MFKDHCLELFLFESQRQCQGETTMTEGDECNQNSRPPTYTQNLITRPKWQERQRSTGVSLIPLSPPSHLRVMRRLDNIHTHRHKSKGKGHPMNLKMINADWDRHTRALPPLHSQKWALSRPPPSFGRRWDCQIGLPATLLANREAEVEEGGGRPRSWVWGRKDRAYWRGVMEVEGWQGVGNGAECLKLINEGTGALCPLCVDSADFSWLFRALRTQLTNNSGLFLLFSSCK